MVSRRLLGRTGLSAGAIGLGTVKLGRNTDVKYPTPFELPSDTEVAALLDAALAMGVNLIDTAPAYGESERRLAPFLAAHRDEIVLCTKCGEHYKGGASIYDFSAGAVTASAESSLRRLGTDRLDILLLHSDGRDLEIMKRADTLAALNRLKSQGKVRATGISAKTAEGIAEAAKHFDVVMAPFSRADASLGDALAGARKAGLAVLAIKGLQSGRLGEDAESAVAHVLEQPFVDVLVIGTLNPAHLRTAVRAAERVVASSHK